MVEPDREPESEDQRPGSARADDRGRDLCDRPHRDDGPRRVDVARRHDEVPEDDDRSRECERAQEMEPEQPAVECHAESHDGAAYAAGSPPRKGERAGYPRASFPATIAGVDTTARHLRLLTETIAAVNSSLDLEEVLALVASKVADALDTDACFVYLYEENADELVLRATHGTRVEEMTRTP